MWLFGFFSLISAICWNSFVPSTGMAINALTMKNAMLFFVHRWFNGAVYRINKIAKSINYCLQSELWNETIINVRLSRGTFDDAHANAPKWVYLFQMHCHIEPRRFSFSFYSFPRCKICTLLQFGWFADAIISNIEIRLDIFTIKIDCFKIDLWLLHHF